jgi:hypothetical protein
VTLVRLNQEGGDLAALGSRAAALEAELAARDAEIAGIKAGLAAFKITYRQEVGLLHEELDELERAIAEAELGELAKQAERRDREANVPPAGPPAASLPRFTSDAVRRLFRDVAKAVHPDLARDAHTRDRRHTLMIEANRAYAVGDEERLRSILQAWENSPEAVVGNDPESARLLLERRVAQIEQQLELYAIEAAALTDTPLWKLKAMVDAASARGKDLVRDMVRRLKRDILVAQNRLDAMRPSS